MRFKRKVQTMLENKKNDTIMRRFANSEYSLGLEFEIVNNVRFSKPEQEAIPYQALMFSYIHHHRYHRDHG